jgi:hypothetical protein
MAAKLADFGLRGDGSDAVLQFSALLVDRDDHWTHREA